MTILAISGSLQRRSANGAAVRAAVDNTDLATFVEFDALADIPYFNAELDGDATPPSVVRLREALASASAVLIATPEYGHSLPGVLKNALDWLVGSGELANKPIAIVSASPTTTGGIRAQIALAQTLLAQSAEIVAMLPIAAVKTKLDPSGNLVDSTTLRRLRETIIALVEAAQTAVDAV